MRFKERFRFIPLLHSKPRCACYTLRMRHFFACSPAYHLLPETQWFTRWTPREHKKCQMKKYCLLLNFTINKMGHSSVFHYSNWNFVRGWLNEAIWRLGVSTSLPAANLHFSSSQCAITCKWAITTISKLTKTSGPKFLWENDSDNDIVLKEDTDLCCPTSLSWGGLKQLLHGICISLLATNNESLLVRALTNILKLTKTSGPKVLWENYSDNTIVFDKNTDFCRPTLSKLRRSETDPQWNLHCVIGTSQCAIICKGAVTKISKLTKMSRQKFLWENYSDNNIVLEKGTDFCCLTSLNLKQSETAPRWDLHCILAAHNGLQWIGHGSQKEEWWANWIRQWAPIVLNVLQLPLIKCRVATFVGWIWRGYPCIYIDISYMEHVIKIQNRKSTEQMEHVSTTARA